MAEKLPVNKLTGAKSETPSVEHNITIKCRSHMEISGINEVLSFDDTIILLQCVDGELEINGEMLHISVLDVAKGNIVLDGKINSVYYNDNRQPEKKGFFGRLLK